MFEISNLRELLFWAFGWLPVGFFVFMLYGFLYITRDFFRR